MCEYLWELKYAISIACVELLHITYAIQKFMKFQNKKKEEPITMTSCHLVDHNQMQVANIYVQRMHNVCIRELLIPATTSVVVLLLHLYLFVLLQATKHTYR